MLLVLVDNLVSCHTNVHTKIWGIFLFTFVTKIWKVYVTKHIIFLYHGQPDLDDYFSLPSQFFMNRHDFNNGNWFQISKDFDLDIGSYYIEFFCFFSNSPTHFWNIFLCMNSDYTVNSSKFSWLKICQGNIWLGILFEQRFKIQRLIGR